MIQNKLNAGCEYILLRKSLPQEYGINITLWIGTKMIWGNLKLRLIQTSRMAKSNQLFVISFALREPCLKLINGQANMLLYEVLPK